MEAAKTNIFAGLSSLRAQEKSRQPPSEQAEALKAYLKKYTDQSQPGKSTKKKRKKPAQASRGLQIIDEDKTGFSELVKERLRENVEAAENSDEEAPVVANPEEAQLYARLAAKVKSGAALENWSVLDSDAVEPGTESTVWPARRRRHDSPDPSPPRRRLGGPAASPPRKRQESPDASPPRRRQTSPGASPLRRRHDSPDTSPRRRHDSPDASPPRRQHESPDASPPRRRHASPDSSPPRRAGISNARDHSNDHQQHAAAHEGGGKNRSSTQGLRAGIISGEALTSQLSRKQMAEKERFAKLEATHGSKRAETVYRDKETGRRMTKEEFEAEQKEAADKKPKYETPQWGGGIKQKRDREEEAAAMAQEASRQFARSREDVDQELNLRDRARFGDPMAHLVKRKDAAIPAPVVPEHLAKQMKKAGFVIPQDVPNHSWLKRGMGPPPNRYGIRPGRHWDGVDRSTGFERDMFKQQAARAALEREARMWAQSDM